MDNMASPFFCKCHNKGETRRKEGEADQKKGFYENQGDDPRFREQL